MIIPVFVLRVNPLPVLVGVKVRELSLPEVVRTISESAMGRPLLARGGKIVTVVDPVASRSGWGPMLIGVA